MGIPTSKQTEEQARSLGIPLTSLDDVDDLHVAIDGADNIDNLLNLVKGGGGALLREKMVALRARKFIVVADETKNVVELGPGFPVPVEITPFCHLHTLRRIKELPSLSGCRPVLRLGSVSNIKVDGEEPAVTDNGNYIIDLYFDAPIKNAAEAAKELKNTIGVLDHGLFIAMTTATIVAGKGGVSVKVPN